ncbi:ABC transporter permease [Clostridium botulinum]|uniref:Peptide ABC transporter permease n=1 Tax=Clostridium botulinum C/D str. DC5 TaxID=1443128 RepID=A0A0A0IGU2_CLOBO|nr:ABC transporter permease [Clostridium botulinum]KGM94320.1 peptide ABC transporter permease [Clostridium botulinum D str. CCUG 7971]KGM99491.1 peptide ABC transporter permease [Clostridium botulinum C/D str. DC5]KOC47602.1 peptide ABC transporter permease [Clostridium botulinum]KOC55787.1 peptide ABC transporter permease [Clostridium botulinum]KOC56386.1 peptide ABC transporter permease [Clostridium botulinum]
MAKYILKRIGYMVVTLWVIITATFFLMNSIPGDPVMVKAQKLPPEMQQIMREQYGLDKPLTTRYVIYLKNLTKGQLGDSFITPGYNVQQIIDEKFPNSARLGVQAVCIGLVIGVILGVVAAFRRNTNVDFVVIFLAILGVSIPSFVLAALLQKGFGGGVLPIAGWYDSGDGIDGIKFTILPTLALCFGSLATYARYMRTSVLDVIGKDYIITAKAKGLSQTAIAWKHIIRNAILPIITILGPQLAAIITGSIVIERIFAIPGIGNSMIDAILTNDYNIIMGLTIFYSALYIVSLLIVDIMYSVIDPRIRLTGEKR